MKRLLSCLLLILLLCGCGPETPETTGETQPSSVPVDPLLLQSITAGKPETAELPEQLVGTSVCRLKMLPLTAAVQRFAFLQVGEELWIFATQCSKDTTYLIRFLYDPETKIASPQNITTLTGYGHGESLEVLQRDGKVYVYIGGRAKHAFTSYYWSTTVTRFCYEDGQVTEVKELTDLNCATATGEPLHPDATAYRINFALNQASDRMALYVQCDTNDSLKNIRHYICAYKFSEIDAMLDKAESTVSMKDCTAAMTEAPQEITTGLIQVYSTYQGMDLSDTGALYVSSGGTGEAPGFKQLNWSQSGLTLTRQSLVGSIYAMRYDMQDWVPKQGYPETECIRYYNGHFYACFNPGGELRMNQTELFILSAE